jgi:hypothetical protein
MVDDKMDNQERINRLASVLRSYSPGVPGDKAVDSIVTRKLTTEREKIFELVTAIFNGVAFDTWPWSKEK